MKRFMIIVAALVLALNMSAKDNAKYMPKSELRPDKTVFLYVPEKANLKKIAKELSPVTAKKPETLALEMAESNGITEPEEMFDPNGATKNISDYARFDLYFPKNPNGQMMVVCPGGGYGCVCEYIEGLYAAEWLVSQGITVAVVKYRLPNGHASIPLTDVQEVFRYCRKHQGEWGVSKVGIMGFSAGGHLAASASVLYDDAVTRPDFSVLIYPLISLREPFGHVYSGSCLLGSEEAMSAAEYKRLSYKFEVLNHVSADTPPTYIALGSDDKEVSPLNSVAYYQKLLEFKVASELHIFSHGTHGFSFESSKYTDNDLLGDARDDFYNSLARWLKSLK
ncbi:MAG: alpha/beta hydrolase [Bacteroidales bacterium]|nr:alpha/beta hydrolase [Candidatus Equibacterium intestinale]